MEFEVKLPNREGNADQEILNTSNNIVLIGANGSGKSRLGVWIEQQLQEDITVHRISAQKALNIPEYAQVKNLEEAEKELLLGRSDDLATINRKERYRWGRKPATYLLNDYDKLLSLLFAKATERDRIYTNKSREVDENLPVPDSPIEQIVKIWKDIMPHRKIIIEDGKVLVRKEGSPEYHGQEMSDGERVALYLIGQCLCAPENSIIIIDEPEIHLHKSLVDKLWNKIEELSQRKLLIYITHDLEFASSRTDAHKLWIKNFKGNQRWEWEEVPEDETLPESLLIEIVGNRKNVIFVEGESGSLDSTVYQLIYSNHHIIPRASCQKVIQSTKAFRANTSLHHLQAYGIIDSDYRDDEEKEALKEHGVFTLPVAEIENLLCLEPVLRILAEHLQLNPEKKVEEVVDFICEALRDEFEVQVTNKAENKVQFLLGSYSKEDHNIGGLKDGLDTTLSHIDIDRIYNRCHDLFKEALNSKDLETILLLYNRKSLHHRISDIFGLGNKEYGRLFIRLMKGEKKEELLAALNPYLPELE